MLPDRKGHFGIYGGKYVPETLMGALRELEVVYAKARRDKNFRQELAYYLKEYAGRPTPLYFAKNLSHLLGHVKII